MKFVLKGKTKVKQQTFLLNQGSQNKLESLKQKPAIVSKAPNNSADLDH